MMRVAEELGFTTEFCGARRDKGLPDVETFDGQKVVRVGPYFPLLGGKRAFFYARSVFRYNVALYRHLKAVRPQLIHASDVETMPACMLFRIRFGGRLVYNIHDNLAQRYAVPSVIAALLNAFEGLLVKASDVTLVPEDFRRDSLPRWCRKKITVVRNTPEDVGYSDPDETQGKIRIFFGGWLDWGRGLRQLIRLAETDPDVELSVAGEGTPDIGAHLEQHSRVRYLGFLPHSDLMDETRRCHVVAALYDPSRPINRFAAPNKLAEAFCVGRPVMLSRETALSRDLEGRSCVLLTDYDRAERMGDRLRMLVNDSKAYISACHEARQLYEERYAWEPVRERIRDLLSDRTELT